MSIRDTCPHDGKHLLRGLYIDHSTGAIRVARKCPVCGYVAVHDCDAARGEGDALSPNRARASERVGDAEGCDA